jgi:hypothetical protein
VGFAKGIAVGELVNKVLAMGETVAFDERTDNRQQCLQQ